MTQIAKITQGVVIRQLLVALHPFFVMRSTMPARCIQAFLLVAEKEGASVTEIAVRASMSATSMSRILLDMGERDRNYEPGAGLVEGRENPDDRREKLYYLTSLGRDFLAGIVRDAK